MDSIQVIIDLYKQDVDRSLIEENLKLTVEERLLQLQDFMTFAEELKRAGQKISSGKKAEKIKQ